MGRERLGQEKIGREGKKMGKEKRTWNRHEKEAGQHTNRTDS